MKNLKITMIKRDINANDIAKILDISYAQVRKILNGEHELNATKIKKLCKALNVTADYLLELENE